MSWHNTCKSDVRFDKTLFNSMNPVLEPTVQVMSITPYDIASSHTFGWKIFDEVYDWLDKAC